MRIFENGEWKYVEGGIVGPNSNQSNHHKIPEIVAPLTKLKSYLKQKVEEAEAEGRQIAIEDFKKWADSLGTKPQSPED